MSSTQQILAKMLLNSSPDKASENDIDADDTPRLKLSAAPKPDLGNKLEAFLNLGKGSPKVIPKS